jgi:putative ABC transport system permease protein
MFTFIQDLQYGLRTLVKRPAFTLVAVMTLALGIGANTTVYTFLNAVLFEPIPFKDNGRTVFIWSANAQQHEARGLVSVPDFVEWRNGNQVFDEMGAFGTDTLTLTGGGEPERVQATFVTASFFPMLQTSAKLGRTFLPSEELPSGDRSTVLSYGFWQRRFGGDPNVIGKTLMLDSAAYTIVGVMPQSVWFPRADTSLWLPLRTDSGASRSSRFLMTFGFLKNGTTLQQARSNIEAIAATLSEKYPNSNAGWTANVVSLNDALLRDTDRAVMRLLIATVMFVLLIACANISNLLLSRAVGRQKEIAVRTALGATRLRLIRQLLTESFALSILGGVFGLVLAIWGADALIAAIPHRAPAPDTLINGFIFVVTLLVSLVAAMVFGIAPAFEVSKTDVNSTLKEGGRSGSGSMRGRRFRSALIVAEVSLALVLLIGGGLVIRQSIHIQNIDPGFPKRGLLSVEVELPQDRYRTNAEITSFYDRTLAGLSALPGARSSALTTRVPITSDGETVRFVAGDLDGAPVQERPLGARMVVSSAFFQTLGIPIVKGRAFSAADSELSAPVAVVNETLATRYFAARDAIGQSVAISNENGELSRMTIVGISKDLMPANLALGKRPQIYVNSSQFPQRRAVMILRTEGESAELAAAARRAVWNIDPNLPIDKVADVEQLINEDFRGGIALSYVFAVFGAVALTLATVGIYGVIAYSAAQRTQEIGIRLALGATRRDVLRMVVGHGMKLVAAGVTLGLIGGFAITRILSGVLIGVSATDPLTFLTATAILTAVGFAATYLPARRATRIDPMTALRYE